MHKPAIFGGVIKVKYQTFFSAIDGKVMNALVGNNDSAKCPFCLINWKEVMDTLKVG